MAKQNSDSSVGDSDQQQQLDASLELLKNQPGFAAAIVKMNYWFVTSSFRTRLKATTLGSDDRLSLIIELINARCEPLLPLIANIKTLDAYIQGPLAYLEDAAFEGLFGVPRSQIVSLSNQMTDKAERI